MQQESTPRREPFCKPVRFFVPCIPPEATHQSTQKIFFHGGGGVSRGKNRKGQQVAKLLFALFHPFKPATPFGCPVAVEIDWVSPWRKCEPKWRLELGQAPRFTKPDADNLSKFALDALEQVGFFATGDQQVAQLTVRKWWGNNTGIGLRVLPL